MIRVLVTGVVAFAVLVLGYHHFAAASSPAGGSAAATSSTGAAPKTTTGAAGHLSTARLRLLGVEQARWQTGFLRFMRAAPLCAMRGLGTIGARPHPARCVAPAYRAWAVPFARFRRDAAGAVHSLGGPSSCRTILSAAAGLNGPGATLTRDVRRLVRDDRRAGDATGIRRQIADTRRAIAAEAAMVQAGLSLATACG